MHAGQDGDGRHTGSAPAGTDRPAPVTGRHDGDAPSAAHHDGTGPTAQGRRAGADDESAAQERDRGNRSLTDRLLGRDR